MAAYGRVAAAQAAAKRRITFMDLPRAEQAKISMAKLRLKRADYGTGKLAAAWMAAANGIRQQPASSFGSAAQLASIAAGLMVLEGGQTAAAVILTLRPAGTSRTTPPWRDSQRQPAEPEVHVTKTKPPVLWCEARATPTLTPRVSPIFGDDTEGTTSLQVLLENLAKEIFF